MEQMSPGKIMEFLSNNFELFMYVSGSLAVLFLVLIVAVQWRFVSKRIFFRSTLRSILSVIIVAGQIISFVLLGCLYWKNYQAPAPELKISEDMSATTLWTNGDFRVYFIEDKTLRSIKINGTGIEDVFHADWPINEYRFSPDGKYLLVLTQKDLYLVDRQTKENRRIDSLEKSGLQQTKTESETDNGSINGVQWALDSQKFVYEIARWSKFASQDNVYVYSVSDQAKKSIKSPARRISLLYWGKQSENLYYLQHEAQDTSASPTAFEVKVFRIPVSTLVPEFVTEIPFEKSAIPLENLNVRDINLFLEGNKLAFSRSAKEDYGISSKGSSIDIDDDDYLYFVKGKWFRKRLFKIPRESQTSDLPRYQYKGGDLVIDQIRWIPGGRFVIMEHKYWGVLIFEPATGKIGLLIQANGHTFGWYQRVNI